MITVRIIYPEGDVRQLILNTTFPRYVAQVNASSEDITVIPLRDDSRWHWKVIACMSADRCATHYVRDEDEDKAQRYADAVRLARAEYGEGVIPEWVDMVPDLIAQAEAGK